MPGRRSLGGGGRSAFHARHRPILISPILPAIPDVFAPVAAILEPVAPVLESIAQATIVPRIAAILTSIEDVFAPIAPVFAAVADVFEPIPPFGRPRRLRRERARHRQKREGEGRDDDFVQFPHRELRHRRCFSDGAAAANVAAC